MANHEALDQRVQRLTDREWSSSSKLYVGGKLLMEHPLGTFFGTLFFDSIHHRVS